MQRFLSKATAGVILLMLFPPSLLMAESVRSFVDSGNKAYGQGNYAKSLDQYEKASKIAPDSAVALFNKGDALYKLGKYTEAFNAYEQAAGKAVKDDNRPLEAQSRYNMGNSAFRRAEKLEKEDPETAFEEFNRSSQNFQSVLKLDPNISDAAHNLEVARIKARQVEELMRRQQQQKQRQQEAREQAEKELKDLIKQQDKAAAQSREAAKDLQKSQQGQGNGAEHRLDQLKEKQSDIKKGTEALNKKVEELSGKTDHRSGDKKVGGHIKRSLENQANAQEKLGQRMPEQASVSQKEAAEELRKALQQMKNDGKGEKQKEAGDGQKKSGSGGNELTKKTPEENKKVPEQSSPEAAQGQQAQVGEMPEDIIKEELKNRKLRGNQRGSGYVPVEKDW